MKRKSIGMVLAVVLVFLAAGGAWAEEVAEPDTTGPLWDSKEYRDLWAQEAPFEEFTPKDPQPCTYTVMLTDDTQYNPESPTAREAPDEVFDALYRELANVKYPLSNLMKKIPAEHVADPDLASVVIVVEIRFPFAGSYTPGTNSYADNVVGKGQVDAYDCVLTVSAYSADRHSRLAHFEAERRFGKSISTSATSGSVWKEIPEVFELQESTSFLEQLKSYWKVK